MRKCMREYLKFYRMSPDAFDYLTDILTPYLRSQFLHLVRPQLETRKIVAIVLYRLAHGYSPHYITDRFKVGGSIVCKYVDIVCNILSNKDK